MDYNKRRRRIPGNFNYWGNKIQNFVETALMDGLCIFIIFKLSLGFEVSIYLGLVLIPITVFGIVGLNNQSLLTALFNWIMFMKNRRVLEEPDSEYRKRKDKAMIKKRRKERK
ncbi:hypothetical protein N5B56_01830 [Eubacterium sp. LFL-14]|uniref:PrgI family protein n=1 Tax=Eubacterium album TaxID=2978477 RepID=A0ABT2LX08_9FIRM|nr:hypothetical protein [Eubacterium sp. LFL-14]MCT7397827.1 hypothetical protein [Eubacterium sp. LFL-14]